MVGDVKLGAELFYRLKVHATLKSHINGYGDKLEFFGIKATELSHSAKQGEGVLAGRDSDGYLVALFYHIVIVDPSARVAEEAFHIFHTCFFLVLFLFKF